MLEKTAQLREVQSLLDDGTAVLEYIAMPYHKSAVLWITRTQQGVCFVPAMREWKRDVSEMARLNDLLREDKATPSDLLAVAQRLRPMLIQPVLNAMKAAHQRVDHLAIVRDNVLWGLNFDVLAESAVPTPKNGQRNYRYLIEDYATSYPFSINVLGLSYKDELLNPGLEAFTASYTEERVVCSGPSEKLQPLSNLCDAAVRVCEQWDAPDPQWRRHLYTAAVRDSFVERMGYADIALIVLHACALPKQSPLQYEMAFSDKNLTVGEVYSFKRVNPKLIYMAACNTAWGHLLRGEGQACVSRAFAFKGCPTMISAISQVLQIPTDSITVDFFAEFKKGSTAARSLQVAKLKRVRESPHFWANMICLGNGNVRMRRVRP